MAAPQDGYGQGYPPADQYAQQSPVQQGFAATTSPPPPAGQEHEGGKKKKRGYAAQAYDFGAGANHQLQRLADMPLNQKRSQDTERRNTEAK